MGCRAWRGGRQRSAVAVAGFSLLETAIALAILGLALALSLVALSRGPRFIAEQDDRQRALRAVEAALEGIRSGSTPVLVGNHEGGMFSDGDDAVPVRLAISETPITDLYRVEAAASFQIRGEERWLVVTTLTWSP